MGASVWGYDSASSATAIAVTSPGMQTRSGSALVAMVGFSRFVGAFSSITDSLGNTWTQIGTEQQQGTDGTARFYRAENITGSNQGPTLHTVTFTGSVANMFLSLLVLEIRGVTTTPLDQSSGNVDVATPFTAPIINTTSNNEMLVSGILSSNLSGSTTFTPGNSYEFVIANVNAAVSWTMALAVRYVQTTGAYQPSWTTSAGAEAIVFSASFIEDSAQNIDQGNGANELRHIPLAA